MKRTLFAKLSLALFAIVALLGSGFFVLEQASTRLYYEEITQRLNASIAMYVTGERQLIEHGVVNEDALTLLAQQAMVINPTVEIYLLDADGAILAHALPPGAVQSRTVALGPVRQLMAGTEEMPLRGTDPRNPGREKVFSAHPVEHQGELQGYLYAVLGGARYDELADSIRSSYIQRLSLGALVAIVVAAFLVGLLVFGLLTRRLVRLTRDVRRFTDAGFDASRAADLRPGPDADRGDEISQLHAAFARMASKIIEQFEGLQETDRLRRELVSNVSHDLRTPLASMHGYVETLLLKNDTLTARERAHYLSITRKHTTRLRELIGDLFELSKLDAASVHPQLESFSLAELLHDVAQEFELQAEQRKVALRIDVPPDASTVVADISLMQRVLENLIRNALRYTPQGGHILLRLRPAPGSVAVCVEDTGCGIAEENLDRVFDRYYHSGQNGEEDESSAGLGLAIVRKILELHGSRITVHSAPGAGTRFEFALPARRAAA